MSQYYVRWRGKIMGPFQISQLQSMLQRNQLTRHHEISDDRQNWCPAGQVPELFPPELVPESTPSLQTYTPSPVEQELDEDEILNPGSQKRKLQPPPRNDMSRPPSSNLFQVFLILLIIIIVAGGTIGYFLIQKDGSVSIVETILPPKKMVITVKVTNINPLMVPKWSVDHELRINGKVVDKITNQSKVAEFEGVEAIVGDKISARSMWKNAFGTALNTFATPAGEWPIVSTDKNNYEITTTQE